MATIQEERTAFNHAVFPISNDAHCQRVARLAAEIGHRLRLDANSIHVLSEAAIQHHDVEFVSTNKGLNVRSKEPGEPLDSLQTLCLFYV